MDGNSLFIFENPITTTISASTLALIVLALVVAWEVIVRQTMLPCLQCCTEMGGVVMYPRQAAGAAGVDKSL